MFLLVPAYPGGPGEKAVKRLCVRVCACVSVRACVRGCVCVCKCLSYGAAYQKLQSAVFMLPEKMSLQLSSEQSVDDVGIAQLDWKRVPQAMSRGCKSSVAITTECSRHSVVLWVKELL